MSLRTRQNPKDGTLEVLVKDTWVRFDEYRRAQIDEAYLNSIKFLRDRLGEETIGEEVIDDEKNTSSQPRD